MSKEKDLSQQTGISKFLPIVFVPSLWLSFSISCLIS
jgi:hypothetical protein